MKTARRRRAKAGHLERAFIRFIRVLGRSLTKPPWTLEDRRQPLVCDRLKPGQSSRARFSTDEDINALGVPHDPAADLVRVDVLDQTSKARQLRVFFRCQAVFNERESQ